MKRAGRRARVHRAKRLSDTPDRLVLAHALDRNDRAFDEAGDEVALRLDERDDLRPDPDGGGCERCLVLDARSIPSSSVSRPAIRSTYGPSPSVTLKLWFVIPPPSTSTRASLPGQTRSTIPSPSTAR